MRRREDSTADDLRSLTEAVIRFRDERDWAQFHNSKDLFLSLVLEATELAELSQWRDGPELDSYLASKRGALEDELADVLYWVLIIANTHGVDLGKALRSKLVKNAAKYPVEKASGSKSKYTDLS